MLNYLFSCFCTFSVSVLSQSNIDMCSWEISSIKRPDEAFSMFSKWREDGSFTDLILQSRDGKVFPVHKAFVAAWSQYIRDAISFPVSIPVNMGCGNSDSSDGDLKVPCIKINLSNDVSSCSL